VSNLNTIPTPTPDLDSLVTSVRIMKELLEDITGQRRGQGQGCPRMFLQQQQPDTRTGDQLKPGDLWVNPITREMRFWEGRLWELVVV